MPTAKHGQSSVHIAAPPEPVYDLIADITRMGQWSPECYRCEWVPPATQAVEGARFRGHNKLGRYRWITTAVITAAAAGREFAFTVVHDKTGREETVWRYRLEPSPTGTVLTESFEFLWCPIGNRVAELLIPRGRQLRRGLKQTLLQIKSAAEAGNPAHR